MKNMNPIFSLKNFRSFGEEGANFELAPITVLTGCNSAGKSSLVKALMLMARQEFYKEGIGLSDEDRFIPELKLKTSSVDLKLGGFGNVVHMQDTSKVVIVSYKVWSEFLHESVICEWQYKANKGVLADGKLKRLSVLNSNGDILFEGKPVISFVSGDLDEIEVERFEWPDELPETIEENYRRFLVVYNYLYFKIREEETEEQSKISRSYQEYLRKKYQETQKQDDQEDQFVKSLLKDIKDRKESGLNQLKEVNISQEQAEEYDHDAIIFWYQINYAHLKDLDKVVVYNLSEEEQLEKKKATYFSFVINEIVSPRFINNLSFVDSSTNKINRVYNVEDKDKLSAILLEVVNQSADYKYITSDFVNSWLERFKIGERIEIEAAEEGLGVKVYIINKKSERHLMADEGYGITQLVSLLLQIDMIRKKHGHSECDYNFKEHRFKEHLEYSQSSICVEEPEIHLHPKYQSMLAEMFVEAYQKYNIHFIIETHSEYLIRKLQVMVADKENTLTPNDVSLNYVEKDENGTSHNRQIKILKDGRLSEPFGPGFFDEATGLSMHLLKMKMEAK
ncbi:MAG: DUF3696 domain-containing protein [Bacteroidales bacterium]|nr:DUF3696 domain-containing protein [Bacteroidales bacterium]